MGDGHERGYFEPHGRYGASGPALPEERRPEEDRGGEQAARAGPATPAPWVTGPSAGADETLFAAFMAARESAMTPDPDAPLSRRARAWVAAALVVVFLLSLAGGYAAARWVL